MRAPAVTLPALRDQANPLLPANLPRHPLCSLHILSFGRRVQHVRV